MDPCAITLNVKLLKHLIEKSHNITDERNILPRFIFGGGVWADWGHPVENISSCCLLASAHYSYKHTQITQLQYLQTIVISLTTVCVLLSHLLYVFNLTVHKKCPNDFPVQKGICMMWFKSVLEHLAATTIENQFD